MISVELYRRDRPTVLIQRSGDTNPGAWAMIQEALARGVDSGSIDQTVVHADVFLAELDVLRELRQIYAEPIDLGPTLTEHLKSMAADRRARETAIAGGTKLRDLDDLDDELRAGGFIRVLKPFQRENLARVLRLPHAADFSVPGAGKTTLALALFAVLRHRRVVDRLLVVAPIAAFEAWKEETADCFENPLNLVAYRGPDTFVPSGTDVLVSNYHRVASDYHLIRKFVASERTQVVLDEAHRVKRGSEGVHGRTVLDLAYAASRRDVLTGTPAPQGAHDLVALVKFLYPGQDRQILPHSAYHKGLGRDPGVLAETHAAIRSYFVRTPKSALQLPPTTFDVVRREMPAIQSAIYDALVGRYCGSLSLSDRNRWDMRRLGRITMYLLEAATNPMLLNSGSHTGDDPGFTHPPIELSGDETIPTLLAQYTRFETPWKYEEVKSIVEDAAAKGEKVLVWTNFVRNIQALARYLSQFSPAIVHGGIRSQPAPSSDDTVTRDKEFNRFRFDPNCSVLLANPAACGEGVSLHHWCHHAVYLDRSFNASHFLQSQDRIHRLGLDKDTVTKFTVLVSSGTIDDTVDVRLIEKVEALSTLMDDPGLVQVALPNADEGEGGTPVLEDDMAAILAHLEGPDARAT